MAIVSGTGPHRAWISAGGGQFPIPRGSVVQQKTQESSSFCVDVPMDWPGAIGAFSSLSDSVEISVQDRGGDTGTLVTGPANTVEFAYTKRLIVVSGQDDSVKLHQTKVSQKFQNQTPAEIVQTLAGKAGLGVQASGGSLMAGKKVSQDYARLADNVSAASVIHKLAQFEGARWWVKNGTLYYQNKFSPEGSYTINYKAPGPGPMVSDALDLSIVRNIQASQGGQVQVLSWHPKSKQVFKGNASFGGGGGSGGSGLLNYVFHIPNMLEDHAQQHAQSKADEIASHAITIRAVCVGDPSIDVNMALQINGTDFDGSYEMDSVTHVFGMRGHQMTICARTAGDSSS